MGEYSLLGFSDLYFSSCCATQFNFNVVCQFYLKLHGNLHQYEIRSKYVFVGVIFTGVELPYCKI